jgi:dTMP kinase
LGVGVNSVTDNGGQEISGSKLKYRFISLDGIDGGGKSSQIAELVRWLKDNGHDVLAVRDPGSSKLGEAVREILLHRSEIPLDMRAEMLLYMASRAQMVEEIIRPALAAGKVVVSDRFLLANVVYQGCGGGLDIEQLWQVGTVATGGLLPDLTLILDLPVETALARVGEKTDRLESRGVDYFKRVRNGFLSQAARGGLSVKVIAADKPVAEVQQSIRKVFLHG